MDDPLYLPEQLRALFVVGDQKQSIYGFRGADVSVFDEARDIIGTQLAKGDEIPLSVSFRSHPGLIETFNRLFSQILTKNPASPVAKYEIGFVDATDAMTAFRQPLLDEVKEYYGSLELLLVQTEYTGGLSADLLRQWEAYEIAQRLKKLKTEESPIFDKADENGDIYRAFDYGDAAILFQTTTHITIYEDVLKALNIPFVTVAGRGYYNRQEVWDMLNLLKALHSPTDNLSLAAALRSPMFGFSDEMLLALRRLRDESQDRRSIIPLWDALSVEDIPPLDAAQLERIRFARDILHELRDLAGRVTISELLRRSLSKTGYLAALTGLPGGARLRRNVEKLIDIAEASGKITLGAFSHYLDDLTAQEVREGEAVLDASGAVRLMTVHASKGLEFPIVVLVDASRRLRDMDNDVLLYDRATRRYVCKIYDADERKHIGSYAYRYAKMLKNLREEAEHKRLLYVAATRARDCLIVAGSIRITQKGWSVSGWLKQVLAALDLEESDNLHDGFTFDYSQHATIKLHLPQYDESLPQKLRQDDSIFDWKAPAKNVQAQKPPRLQPIVIEPERLLGHLAATQLASIGGFYYAQNTKDKSNCSGVL
ncbi:MAG: 3'-5' exonuclease [Anaerolineae bacterium]|nr:3'-5' exonuclease [Anaerolineae bacterium]